MKPFTVIGYYVDNNQPWADHVQAEDWRGAVEAGRKLLEEGLAVRVCAVVEGNIKVADNLPETLEIRG
jgi:hypothetical protein